MKSQYSKEDTIFILRKYKTAKKFINNGICYFVSRMNENLKLNAVDFYQVYPSLGISEAGLSFDTSAMQVLEGKNPLRIQVVEMLILVLEDPSVYFVELDYPGLEIDLGSDLQEGKDKILALKRFIDFRQDPEKIDLLIQMN